MCEIDRGVVIDKIVRYVVRDDLFTTLQNDGLKVLRSGYTVRTKCAISDECVRDCALSRYALRIVCSGL